ncbi:MAG: energy transducer TonB, partial [Bacteroidetes bacterium]|nr:energy transducer TonB [Bacteroidota bacterium]
MKKSRIICFFVLISCIKTFAQIGYNVEVLPSNVGGKSEFKRVFEQELIYPETSLQNKIGGKVTINFDIKKDSSVSNVKLVSCGAAELDAEAIRLFNLLLWVPAVKEGQSIGTSWTVDYDFHPEKYAKICKQRGFIKFKYLSDLKIDSTCKIYTSGV